jgi:hypothetical protein
VTGLTPRRNHGAATALRGVQSRVFVIGGQDNAGTVLSTVEEYLAQAVVPVMTPHTSLPGPRRNFGIGSSLSTNQIYVVGGVNDMGADQATVFEYTVANNGPVAGPPGTPSGSWVTRSNLSIARRVPAATRGRTRSPRGSPRTFGRPRRRSRRPIRTRWPAERCSARRAW